MTEQLQTGLAPAGSRRPHALVLGSFPSVASLQAGQYYAHRQNQFWPLMGKLFGFDAAMPYRRRIAQLTRMRIAVWDVLGAAVRAGSADAAIAKASMKPNDLAALLQGRAPIAIALNGSFAYQAFMRSCAPDLTAAGLLEKTKILALPSTSPAHARLSLQQKLVRWRRFATALESSPRSRR